MEFLAEGGWGAGSEESEGDIIENGASKTETFEGQLLPSF